METQEHSVKIPKQLEIKLPNPQINQQFTLCPPPMDQIVEVFYPLPNPNVIQTLPMDRQGLDTTNANIPVTIQDLNANRNQNHGCADQAEQRQSRIKWWMRGFVIGFIVLMSLSTIIGFFAIGEQQNEQEIIKDPKSRQQICRVNQGLCKGVQNQVMDYIFGSYSEDNSIKSVLQVARSLSLVEQLNTNAYFQEVASQSSAIYRSITKAVECLSYNLPNNYSNVYQQLTNIQLTNLQQIQAYLKILETFSGQPYKILNVPDAIQACHFKLAPTIQISTQRKDQISNSYTIQNQPSLQQQNSRFLQSQNDASVLNPHIVIYIDGTGYGPNAIVENLKKLRSALAADSRTSILANNIVSMGMSRRLHKNSNLGKNFQYFDKLAKSYEQKLPKGRSNRPTKKSIYEGLKLIAHTSMNKQYLPNDISVEYFIDLIKFHKISTSKQLQIGSLEQFYDLSAHKQFIIQQLNEGRRVAIVGHGQGAMFANALYKSMSTAHKRSIALAYVAPVSCNISQYSASYVTNSWDVIIQHFRTVYRGQRYFSTYRFSADQQYSLSPNVYSTAFTDDTIGLNHDMPGYLKAYTGEFQAIMVNVSKRHILPGELIGTGPVTVNLVWSPTSNTASEIDLHVFEPDSSHVYQYAKKGKNGFMDSNGSSTNEHYFTNPTISSGDFEVRLNYHYGVTNVEVTVMVNAGSEYFVKRVTIGPPEKSAKKSEAPYYVCTIRVGYNTNTKSNEFSIFT